MKGRRFLIGSAIALYLVVVGCVVWPTNNQSNGKENDPGYVGPRRKLEGLPLRGATIQLHDPSKVNMYKIAIDQMVEVGADSVQLVVGARMENGGSARIFVDVRQAPSADALGEIVKHAKSKGLRVQLMPIVLLESPRGNEWRGTIKPEIDGVSAWAEWFDDYRRMIGYFAEVAEANKVDVLVVGSELVSTEDKAAEWAATIRMVRSKFSGMLTYSANWDHYVNIPFWEQLDLIGMNSYWKLGENRHVKVEEIVARWNQIQKDLIAFSNKKGKPLVLVEVGWCSLANAAHEPWDYTQVQAGLDLELQRKLYEGFFRAWHGNPNLGGFYFWEWSIMGAGPEDRGYSPQGKPSEQVLKEWLKKGPWEVK